MMTNENQPTSCEANIARTLLVLDNFEWIKHQAAAVGVHVIPLKGIDLLQTVYAERLDRPVRDIDMLCRSEEDCRRLCERLCQEDYRLAFRFSLRPEALAAKHKVTLLSCNPNKVNIDIHIVFVTKKFFSQTIGRFNQDAIQRCVGDRMEATDRWLFLAQHAAFHAFSDGKWLRDLQVLLDAFTPEQLATLRDKACTYHFRRVTLAALNSLVSHGETRFQKHFSAFDISRSEKRFLRFLNSFHRPFSRRLFDRLVTSYWEFTFIDRRSDRLRMWLQLMFPSPGVLTNIYRIRTPFARLFYYPFNFIVSGITSVLFGITYISRR